MEFWMPANFVRADAVDALCRQYLLNKCDRPALPARSLNGMLMGFADLVFEHEGRYWVLDYKTNRPRPESHDDKARAQGLYARSALQDEMASHRYDVQAAVYLLALHRQLRARLGSSYEPERQLGGAIYWFIRGLDDPARGEYSIAADPSVLQMLEALDHLIGQPEAWS
jgi:exodeoxyribonuclease V beta subunit